MGKIKKKLAEKVLNKKFQNVKKPTNPFEIHINKQKYQVLGQKLKNDRGLPGVSRAKAIKKRKHTLLPEFNVQNKTNKFVDRRIGEKNFNMTEEDRTMARFTAERLKHHSKKSIFNLADDEILTHRGQTLNEIEKFDDPRSDDDDDEDEMGKKSSGKLDNTFVSDAHFGGGILTKTGKEGAKSHKDLIEQLIAESKKRKDEKQKTKEQTLELTEKLDSEWKDLLPLVNKSNKVETQQKPDDYDKVMQELRFEARGHPSDRLKSEDEIAKEEKKKLEKLEEDRLNRMKGFSEISAEKKQHKSADDLDDNFYYESDPEVTLAYNEEGKIQNDIEAIIPSKIENTSHQSEDEHLEEENDEEDSSEPETEDDDLSDLKQNESDSDVEKNVENNEIPERKRKLSESVIETSPLKIQKVELKGQENDPVISEIMEKAKKELPFTYAMPDSYENLQSLLSNQPPEYQDVIIERMIKCNHPSLAEKNKESLNELFVYLLQYLNDVALNSNNNDVKQCFLILNSLTPHLYYLTQQNPINSLNSLIEVIQEKQNDYKKKCKIYPGLEVLVFLKLISCLFSTSDFRHQIVTPSLLFISQMLTNCRIKTRYDIAYGLFLVTLFLEYTALSKRFMPAALIYLMGIVHMAIPKLTVRLVKILPPFKSNSTELVLLSKYEEDKDLKMSGNDLVCDKLIDENFKVRTLYTTLKLIEEFHENWKNLSSHINMFDPFFKLLDMIPKDSYPKLVQEQITKVKSAFEDSRNNKKIEFIVYEKKKPKALRLYEPNIQKVFNGKKYKSMSKEKAEREKLLHKYKKEMKGAIREIRRDKSFIGGIKIKQQIQSDLERKEKVRRIYAEASIQQGELNALDRKKKRK